MAVDAGILDEQIVAGRQQRPQQLHLGQYVVHRVIAVENREDPPREVRLEAGDEVRHARGRGGGFDEGDVGIPTRPGIKRTMVDVHRQNSERFADLPEDVREEERRAAFVGAELDHQ